MAKRKSYVPERGDIIFTDFDPTKGHEQAGERPALVLSPKVFQEQTGLVVVAPITNTIKGHGLEVKVDSANTTGVVLIHQLKSIDYEARGVVLKDKATDGMISEALKKAGLLFKGG